MFLGLLEDLTQGTNKYLKRQVHDGEASGVGVMIWSLRTDQSLAAIYWLAKPARVLCHERRVPEGSREHMVYLYINLLGWGALRQVSASQEIRPKWSSI